MNGPRIVPTTRPDNRRIADWTRLEVHHKMDFFLKVAVLCCVTLYVMVVTIVVVAMVHGEFAQYLFGN